MLAAIFAVLFGLSLLPGRKPLCFRFAEKISGDIMPTGAYRYCYYLTWLWFLLLTSLASCNVFFYCRGWYWASGVCLVVSGVVVPLTIVIEHFVRRKRFSVYFTTSGSTGKSKVIVKPFESLAKEVGAHRAYYHKLLGPRLHPQFLATIDPRHMYGTLWRVMLPRAMNCAVDPEIILSPEELLAKMRQEKKVFLVTTPSFLERFTAYADQYQVPQNCVEIVTSGALLTKEISDRTQAVFGIAPRQIFGSTETGGVAWRRGDAPWQVMDAVQVKAVQTEDAAVTRLAVKSPYSFQCGWYVMGDGVELAEDARTFKLLGRTDRLVKINEERVNLVEMEEAMRRLGFEDCALAALDGERGAYLGAVLVSANPVPSLVLRKQCAKIFPKGTVPKKFRFVAELPRNTQGKVLKADIVKILEGAASFATDYRFDGSEHFFQGHFPAAAVLPGVVQLGKAVQAAQAWAGVPLVLKAVKRMKFMRVIQPNETVRLQLTRPSETTFAYEWTRGEDVCSSGVLQF